MRVHHLNCGSFCPRGKRLVNREGDLLERALVVCHCLAVETGGDILLVDTGFGIEDAHDPGRLGAVPRWLMDARPEIATTALAQLEASGFGAADVRHIVTTHLDSDHTGGLADFPEAEVHVFAPELAAARHPSLREKLRYRRAHWEHNPRWVEHGAGGDKWFGFESVRILDGLDEEIALIPLNGHTRGHTGVAINRGDGWLLHCGDAIFDCRELAAPPSCPPLLGFFQNLTAADNAARKANRERLRELTAMHGDEVDPLCSHDTHDLERRQAEATTAAATE
jgi:glyoxylase-like metal-dependent hydrolase (beta-lactamase superfamily II)